MEIAVPERARQAKAVGNAITKLHREHYGRGATTTRTLYQRDYVVCFLEDIYTPVERTLIEAGKHEDVKHTRQSFQMVMRERFAEVVEEITGRTVIQFMSQVCFEPDMAAEVFVLEPAPGGDVEHDSLVEGDGRVTEGDGRSAG